MSEMLNIDNVFIGPGEKKKAWLAVCQDFDGPVKIPLLAANGLRPGKCLYVVNGLYGDEYNGMDAIYRLYRQLEPEKMCGQFISVPMLNTPAFDLIKRNGPDDVILNRTGSGDKNGFLTEKITAYFIEHIAARANYGIEIIEIGQHYSITDFVALVPKQDGNIDLEYAKSYGAELLWSGGASNQVLRNAVAKTGVEVIMTELGGQGTMVEEFVHSDLQGVLNVLKHLQIIGGRPENLPTRYRRYEGFWMHSRAGGIFRSHIKLRQEVKAGDDLATISDMMDQVLEIIKAPHDGIVIGCRTNPRIRPGDWTIWISNFID